MSVKSFVSKESIGFAWIPQNVEVQSHQYCHMKQNDEQDNPCQSTWTQRHYVTCIIFLFCWKAEVTNVVVCMNLPDVWSSFFFLIWLAVWLVTKSWNMLRGWKWSDDGLQRYPAKEQLLVRPWKVCEICVSCLLIMWLAKLLITWIDVCVLAAAGQCCLHSRISSTQMQPSPLPSFQLNLSSKPESSSKWKLPCEKFRPVTGMKLV